MTKQKYIEMMEELIYNLESNLRVIQDVKEEDITEELFIEDLCYSLNCSDIVVSEHDVEIT